jgi:hypothetical protein
MVFAKEFSRGSNDKPNKMISRALQKVVFILKHVGSGSLLWWLLRSGALGLMCLLDPWGQLQGSRGVSTAVSRNSAKGLDPVDL